MKVTEPRVEAIKTPNILFDSPRYLKIISSGIRKREMDKRMSMIMKAGRIFRNFLPAILTAASVFLRFTTTDNNIANNVPLYRKSILHHLSFEFKASMPHDRLLVNM